VRSSFDGVSQAEAFKRMGIDGSKFVLGITGGSQGAHQLNKAMLPTLHRMKKITVLWSCGRNNYEELARDVANMRDVHLYPFVDDMVAFLSASALVISRAGATSLSELAACKTPSILVPYPYAADDHQRRNARAWEEAGAAVVVTEGLDFSDRLEEVLVKMMNDRVALAEMRKSASRLYDPLTLSRMADTAERIVREAKAPNGEEEPAPNGSGAQAKGGKRQGKGSE
jgi:UDP-N-acetylglucosamine--N-acetylmuramyl-(pentapeptide) pyrophosphoryl-undecaprenol N-acetylglucosamine transferase